MARNNTYPTVNILPPGALTVAEYCRQLGISTTVFYMRLKRGTADYTVVVFQGINFVIP